MTTYKEGFYYLTSEHEPEPVLVHGYNCSDLDGEFVFGFNTHDGGGLLPLSEMIESTKIVPVTIREQSLDDGDNSDSSHLPRVGMGVGCVG